MGEPISTPSGATLRSFQERELVRAQARAARRISQALRDQSLELSARREAVVAASLEIATYLNDQEPTPERRGRVLRLGAEIGRSPEIEDAKDILAARHGLSRAEAWEVLRRVSQRRSCKLRQVAHDLVIREHARSSEQAVTAHLQVPNHR